MAQSSRAQFQGLFSTVNTGQASVTPGAATTGITVTVTVPVTNCAIGDIVDVSAPAAIGNLTMSGEVTAAGTVTIKFANVTAGSLTAPAGVYKVTTYTPSGLFGS